MTEPIRVLLVDDHDLVRDGLAAILAADPAIEIVGEVADGPAAVRVARDLTPDIVLMDVEMPGGDGLTATRTILASCPTTRVVILTMFDLDENVFQALRIGASGFLLKTTPTAKLVDAVKACAAGETLLAPSVVDRLITTYVEHPPSAPQNDLSNGPLQVLTPRELDVLRAIARGLSNAEISTELYLAEATVKTHITRILAKLGLRDRVQAVVLAYETGLVPPR
ncbi:MAG TPA: response regulator transcription factor [Microlunatus sp.]